MLIALYFFIINVALPQIGAYAHALLEPVMVIVITLAGIVMIFGAVGMKISNNLGSTIVDGIFKAITYIVTNLIKVIGWSIRQIFRMIPRVFRGSRRTFTEMGLNSIVSNLLAMIITVVFIGIII